MLVRILKSILFVGSLNKKYYGGEKYFSWLYSSTFQISNDADIIEFIYW